MTKAARLLGVHPNTVRAWSDQGRLRYYRINPRGDRRYRLGDLQRFLAAAETGPVIRPMAAGSLATGPRVGGVAPREAPRRPAGRPIPAAKRPVLTWLDGGADATRVEQGRPDLELLTSMTAMGTSGLDLDTLLARAVGLLHERCGFPFVAVWERHPDRFVPRAHGGIEEPIPTLPLGAGLLSRALGASGQAIEHLPSDDADWLPAGVDLTGRLAVAIPPDGEPWGALLIGGDERVPVSAEDLAFARAVAALMGESVRFGALLEGAQRGRQQAEALRRIAADIGGKLDLDQILNGIVEHALVLFGAQRAGFFLQLTSGKMEPRASRGLSGHYLDSAHGFLIPSLPAEAAVARRPLYSVRYRDDPRGRSDRAAVVQEGFDTLCSAPLLDGDELLGLLNLYHDEAHEWSTEELDTLAAFASQASVAIKNARNYAKMASWAAQLQSIQHLGARLSRLTSVREIAQAIVSELGQLIEHHNVRVYRLVGEEDLVAVAMQGRVGEYVDETPEQLGTKLGQGITGWVALHGTAQYLPDAGSDPRTQTIPGTDDIPESMLLAPMIFEDHVLGVLVLSRLGLHQFTDDDLRLLVIYASFAGQAMANADATERLRDQSATLTRRLRSQRALLHITESILATLDPRGILEQITDRLAELVEYDNVAIETLDRTTGRLRPLTAKGVHAAQYMEEWQPGEEGLATWVIANGEPQLVVDELLDPRVQQFDSTGPIEGSIICVPLRGRDGVVGVVSVERLGTEHRFDDEEFELVQLFAGQVSIALQNAELYRSVEVRAQTDDLTGLLNQGTFHQQLQRDVGAGDRFSLLMVDLDNFRDVNNAFGHQAGDRLLERIAAAIVRIGRESDRVYRYGGDEFAMILPSTEAAGALLVAARLREALRRLRTADSDEADGGVEASIGVATFPADGATAEAVLLAADRSCYVAKRKGGNRTATAAEGIELAGQFELQVPTPVDPPTVAAS